MINTHDSTKVVTVINRSQWRYSVIGSTFRWSDDEQSASFVASVNRYGREELSWISIHRDDISQIVETYDGPLPTGPRKLNA